MTEESKVPAAVRFQDALSRVAKVVLDETASMHAPVDVKGFTTGDVLTIAPSLSPFKKQESKGMAVKLGVEYLRKFRAHNTKAMAADVYRWWLGAGKCLINGVAAMILDKWEAPLYMGKDTEDIVATLCVGEFAVQKAYLDKVMLVSPGEGKTLLKTKPDKHMVMLIETTKHNTFVVDLAAVSLGVMTKEIDGLPCPAVCRSMEAAREYLVLPKQIHSDGASAWFVYEMEAVNKKDSRAELAVAIGFAALPHFEKEVGFGRAL